MLVMKVEVEMDQASAQINSQQNSTYPNFFEAVSVSRASFETPALKLEELVLNELVKKCKIEIDRYIHRTSYEGQYGWELWRRAVVEQDNAAWEAVMTLYAGLVRGWLRSHLCSSPSLRQDEDLLFNGTFIKFYRFVDAAKFKNFPSLAALLSYLKMCCWSVVNDEKRSNQARVLSVSLEQGVNGETGSGSEGMPGSNFISSLPGAEDVEKEVLEQLGRSAFWQCLKKAVPDKVDQLLLYLNIMMDMPPREIAALYPQHFNNVQEVYRRTKNLFWRLRKCSDLVSQLTNQK